MQLAEIILSTGNGSGSSIGIPTTVLRLSPHKINIRTSQMRYNVAIESLLLPKHMRSELKADLTERLVDSYKLIIDFQLQTIQLQSDQELPQRKTVNYDSWENKLQHIKDSDKELALKSETAMSAPVSVS
jgi:hypothetical protein